METRVEMQTWLWREDCKKMDSRYKYFLTSNHVYNLTHLKGEKVSVGFWMLDGG